MKSPLKLYWVTTEDHDEDWFVIARSARSARSFFEDYEGYDPADASAELVLSNFQPAAPGPIPRHAQEEDLRAAGFRVHTADAQRVAMRGGRRFIEGATESIIRSADDDAAEARGQGRPNRTKRAPPA